MAKKKKAAGHYCKICGERKANEKFGGAGHAKHICKSCQSLHADEKADMIRCRDVERIMFKYPFSRQDWKLLEKYAKKYADKASGQFAQDILDDRRGKRQEEEPEIEEILLSELSDIPQEDIREIFYDEVEEFMLSHRFLPEPKHKQKIMERINRILRDCFSCMLQPDVMSYALLDEVIAEIAAEMKADGFELSSYQESLMVMETDRLTIRRFTSADIDTLCRIMEKPEVMYAWEHGFTRSDTRKWLNRQQTRYRKDGYGYFAVLLKGSDTLIGQVGLLKSEINGSEVTEIGYIFDNDYWRQGYCTEAVSACKKYAFEELGLTMLHCSIRPNNISSIRIAGKMGMVQTGEHIVIYREQEMPHLIYKVEKA